MTTTAIIERLTRRLEIYSPLSNEEKQGLADVVGPVHSFAPRDDLMREGEPAQGVRLILEGFACRYKLLPDGRRQIVGYMVPGDMCDARMCILKSIDHSIGTLGHVKAVLIPRDGLLELTERYPRLTRALWWSTLVEEAVTREWVVNVGYRTAFERTAHLFCELFTRLHAVGLTHQNTCELPITQMELADALALSAVHVNRTLMEMRRTGLITFRSQHLVIHDLEGLRSAAGFNPNYLYLMGDPATAEHHN